jgi:pyrophosphate--fructose-6-phosphate 1-phosphotransferase
MVNKVAMLTAGGVAPCLSSAIGGLIERYTQVAPEVEIIAYRYGYEGLLQGDSITVTPSVRENAALLYGFGGSPIGNSRVKLPTQPTWWSVDWSLTAWTRCRPRPTG